MNILIVCTANTCRSPMAEGIIQDLINKNNLQEEVFVQSCGTNAFDGEPASGYAVDVCEEIGIDISKHLSQRITFDLIEWADEIYVMSQTHKMIIEHNVPEAAEKTFVLDVYDPFGYDIQTYRRCRDELIDYFERVINAYKGGK